MVRPLGVYQRAVVSLSAPSGVSGYSDCTSPLPNVGVPTTTARSWSCSAPVMISAALAVSPFTSTTTGRPGHGWGLPSRYTRDEFGARPRVSTTSCPGSRNRSLTATPCSSRPPRSEEHTSELQSLAYLVCRLLLEKKKKRITHDPYHLAL